MSSFFLKVEFYQQSSGEGADKNSFYVGVKFYAPSNAAFFREDLADHVTDETYFDFNDPYAGIDLQGRKYSVVWLPVATLVDGVWNYLGYDSNKGIFISLFSPFYDDLTFISKYSISCYKKTVEEAERFMSWKETNNFVVNELKK